MRVEILIDPALIDASGRFSFRFRIFIHKSIHEPHYSEIIQRIARIFLKSTLHFYKLKD